jgi:hypothetical protein
MKKNKLIISLPNNDFGQSTGLMRMFDFRFGDHGNLGLLARTLFPYFMHDKNFAISLLPLHLFLRYI